MEPHKSEQEMLRQVHRMKIRIQSLMAHFVEEEKKLSQSQVLYGTTAEVLEGLVRAFDACEKNLEDSWLAAGRADENTNQPRQATPEKA